MLARVGKATYPADIARSRRHEGAGLDRVGEAVVRNLQQCDRRLRVARRRSGSSSSILSCWVLRLRHRWRWGPVSVKTGAGRRAVPMAFVVRRELMAHKARTGRDGPGLVFGRTATEVFYASTIRARANRRGRKPASSRSPHTKHVTARSRTSSPPASTGSRSPPGRATAMSARPGTATGTSCQAARTRQESVSMPSSRPHNRPRLWRTLWRTTP